RRPAGDAKMIKYLIEQPFKGSICSTVENGRVTFSGHLYNNGGENLTVEEYIKHTGKENLIVVDDDQLDEVLNAFNHNTYLDAAPQRITAERFFELLEVLPPANYLQTGSFERFNMIEHTHHNITQQVVRYGEDYLSVYVIANDPKTWVTEA